MTDNWPGMNTPPVREPDANQRQAAAQIRSMYLAYVAEGFTEAQALKIIGYMLSTAGGQQ